MQTIPCVTLALLLPFAGLGFAQNVPPVEPALAPAAGAIITPATPAPVATAQTARQITDEFLRIDINRDGTLNRAEVLGYTGVRLNFEQLDGNKDGQLSRAEFEKGIR